MPNQSTVEAFLSALTARDFGLLAECLAPEAQSRMYLPGGPEMRCGREEIARRFEGWFARASDFEVLDSYCAKVGPRNRLSWHFRLSRDGQSREVMEQVAFVDAVREGISEIDLLCSGFLREEAVESCAVDAHASRSTR